MKRREMFKLPLVFASSAAAALVAMPAHAAAKCEGEGTPTQFIPKTPKDPNPLENELKKYPKCPYCGMDRAQFHHARHLVQYADDLVDGTCSIHCLSISLAINLDREPKAIYAPDNASSEAVKPLINVDQASYLIGGKLPGVMTHRGKTAYGSKEAALAAKEIHNGEIGDFAAALTASYADLAKDTLMIRKKREERRQHMMKKAG
ncbi:MAG: nitrous oxide reductase accessory protein NosL [Gammaproteobacteria bacterium]|nr:nitrous oxide reductase accessory protein NosL [Gammaproteobacteria bacterium]